MNASFYRCNINDLTLPFLLHFLLYLRFSPLRYPNSQWKRGAGVNRRGRGTREEHAFSWRVFYSRSIHWLGCRYGLLQSELPLGHW